MGWEVARELPGEVVQKMVYDRAGRVKEQRIHTHSYEPTRRQYEWNPSHQLERLTVNGKITEFDYDAFGNLAQADYNQTETIYKVPDAIGNLYKDKDRQGYHYGKGGKLLEDPDWKYSYDEEGNLIQKLSKTQKCQRFSLIDDESGNMLMWQYEWRANGNLERVYNNEGIHISFEYDALGRRTAKINEKTKQITRYLWNGNVLLQEWNYALEDRPKLTVDTQGVVSYDRAEPIENLTTWVYKEDSFVPCAKLVDGRRYSIISDYLGRAIQAYDDNGELVWNTDYDIYGKLHNLQGDKGFIPFRQLGQYEDEETGLYYNRFRYYSPDSGTYLSQDPIGLAGNNPNIYAYVSDSNSWVDVFGLSLIKLPQGVQMVKEVANPRKIVILGENMAERVIPMAIKHGYSVFKPRGTNPNYWMRNQQQWIYRQLKDPTVMILDMGPDPNRTVRSKYYLEEMKYSKKYAGYERKINIKRGGNLCH